MMSRGTSPFTRTISSPAHTGEVAPAIPAAPPRPRAQRAGRSRDRGTTTGRTWVDQATGGGCPVAWGHMSPAPTDSRVDLCSSPNPRGSAPGSRWRSRPGLDGPHVRRPPSTATTRSSTTSWWSSGSRRQGVVFVDDIARRAGGQPDHAVGPRLGARGRRRGPQRGSLRGRLGVPARHQGAPRGEGARGQGLPHRLRRPRGPRGGDRHDGGGPRRDHRVEIGRGGRRAAAVRTSRLRCWRRPRSRTATGRASPCASRAVPRRLDAGPQRPVLRHHEPPGGADGDGAPLRCRRRDRLGQLVEHPGAREARSRGGMRARLPGQLGRRTARRPRRHRRRHGRGLGSRGAGRRRARASRPATASSSSTSPTRTSTSRRRATSASCRTRSSRRRRCCWAAACSTDR
jgi:hypothetical protein